MQYLYSVSKFLLYLAFQFWNISLNSSLQIFRSLKSNWVGVHLKWKFTILHILKKRQLQIVLRNSELYVHSSCDFHPLRVFYWNVGHNMMIFDTYFHTNFTFISPAKALVGKLEIFGKFSLWNHKET